MFEKMCERRKRKLAAAAETQRKAEDARLEQLVGAILKAMRADDGTYNTVPVKGTRSDSEATMFRVGKMLLEAGVSVYVGETCDGFGATGAAVNRRILVVPKGQERPQLWNNIFPPDADVEGLTTFHVLDNVPGKEYVAPTGATAFTSLDPNAIPAVWRSAADIHQQ